MIRIPGKIPIFIHASFWLVAGFLGFWISRSLIGTLIWIGIIFFSVLIHELGHALTAYVFHRNPRIDLVAFGGVTSYPIDKLGAVKQFFIVLNGPVFGFFLFLFSAFLLRTDWITTQPIWVSYILQAVLSVNFLWTLVNLVPVLPLDGGQLMRIIFEKIWAGSGFRISLFVSMLIALAISLLGFLYQNIVLGAVFFLFAFQSFDSFRKVKKLSQEDCDETIRKKLLEGEQALRRGEKERAKELLQQVQEEGKEGILSQAATQYLAFLLFEEGKKEEAYHLLLPIKKELANEALCLLQLLAEEKKDYPLVAELASTCYEISSTQEIAIRNAKAFAFLKEPLPAGGWLQTAWKIKHFDLAKLLQEEVFTSIMQDPRFKKLIASLKE